MKAMPVHDTSSSMSTRLAAIRARQRELNRKNQAVDRTIETDSAAFQERRLVTPAELGFLGKVRPT
jgi:hypothetical protein